MIREAEATEMDVIRALFKEYEAEIQIDLCFQSFEEELAALPGKYAPPSGALFVAEVENQAVGCVALRPIGNGVAEMKRLYVRPEVRDRGISRLLVEAILHAARVRGYEAVRLDTLERMKAANKLYDGMGFKPIPPYYDNPEPDSRFLELRLT